MDLQVRVLGAGFEAPARVRMLLDGDATGIVTSVEAEFVSDKELVTTITVAENATVALWDVEVELLAKRRKGIGIELFEVKTKCLDPTRCEQGGQEPNGRAAWIGSAPDDALTAPEQGVLVGENGKKVGYGGAYHVATRFDSVLALPVVLQDGNQVPVGQCIFRYPDLSAHHPSVTPEALLEVMRNALRRDAVLAVDFHLGIGKKVLGQRHWDHFLELRPFNVNEGDMNLLNPDGTLNPVAIGMLQWGKLGSAQAKDTWDFLRVDLVAGSVEDPSAPRTFRLSDGVLEVFGRLGSATNAPATTLRCDVPDSAIVTILPL